METGLYYNRFRYYSPEEGIYLSQDPIGLSGGKVLYGYVRDVNLGVDVWGLSECVKKEVFYRAMPQKHYDTLVATKRLTPTF